MRKILIAIAALVASPFVFAQSTPNVGLNLSNTGDQRNMIIIDKYLAPCSPTAGCTGGTPTLPSGAQNLVLATPATAAGQAILRALVPADIPTLPTFTSSLPGIVPASGGGTSLFLRADSTWAVPTVPDSGVTAGSYTNSNITVGADGRVTAASSGSAGSGLPSASAANQVPLSTGAGTTYAAGSVASALNGSVISPKVVAGVSKSCNYPGATEDVRFNAAMQDAINHTNGNTSGEVDASCEQGNQTLVTTAVMGNSSGAIVSVILPCGVYWTGTMTGSPVAIQYGGATVTSHCASSQGQMTFVHSSGSTPTYIYEMLGNNVGGSYIYAHGFQVSNVGAGATSSGIGLFINGSSGAFDDASLLDMVNVYDSDDTYAAEVYNVCCSFSWTHSSINGGDGSTPIYFLNGNASGVDFSRAFTFAHGTIVHSGVGKPLLNCTDIRGTTVSSINIDDVYSETGAQTSTTPLYYINGCAKASFEHITFPQYGSAAPIGIEVTSAYNTFLTVDDMWFTYGSGPWTYPIAQAVVNMNAQPQDRNHPSDGNGYFSHYQTPTATVTLGDTTSLGDIPYAGPGGIAAHLSGNTANTDEVLVSRGSGSGSTISPTIKTCTNQSAGGVGAQSVTCTLSTAAVAGEYVVVGAFSLSSPTSLSVTDSAGNTYLPATSLHASSTFSGAVKQVFYFGPLTSSITTLTLSATNATYLTINADTATGLSSTSPVDGPSCFADTSSSTAISCGTPLVTTSAGDYVFCDATNGTGGDNFTAGSGFTAGASFSGSSLAQYKIQPAIGSLTPSVTSSSASPASMICAAFKNSSAPAAPTLSNSPALDGSHFTNLPGPGSETVASSATPTLSATIGTSYMVLTANVTTFTLPSGTDGRRKTLCWNQGTGGFTVTPPSNVHGFAPVGISPSLYSCQDFVYNAANTIWLATSAAVVNQ